MRSVRIKAIHLQNFRAFVDVTTIPLGQITLLYGQNSAGKSSIIKALLFLQQSFNSRSDRKSEPFLFTGEGVDLGSFESCVSNHDVSRQMVVGLTVGYSVAGEPEQLVKVLWIIGREPSRFEVEIHINGRTLHFDSFENSTRQLFVLRENSISDFIELFNGDDLFSSVDNLIADLRSPGHRPVFRRNTSGLLPDQLTGTEYRGIAALYPQSPSEFDEDETSERIRPNGLSAIWSATARDIRAAVSSVLRTTTYLGPLRLEPQRFERFVPVDDNNVGPAGENMLSALYAKPRLQGEVNRFLSTMGMPYEIKVRHLGNRETLGQLIYLALINKTTKVELAPTDVGVGYSQVLPLLTQAAISRRNLLCVEQPELHLHPAMQARLGEVFIEATNSGSNVNFLVETHSENLMLRILRKIREGLSPETVKVLYIDQNTAGASTVHELLISTSGEFISRWPHGFFDERLEEIGWDSLLEGE